MAAGDSLRSAAANMRRSATDKEGLAQRFQDEAVRHHENIARAERELQEKTANLARDFEQRRDGMVRDFQSYRANTIKKAEELMKAAQTHIQLAQQHKQQASILDQQATGTDASERMALQRAA